MALNTQLVSTSQGAEGIEHNGSICIADNAKDFKNSILNILDNQEYTTKAAYDVFLSQYSLSANAKIFEKIIQDL
jgi:hypothetical protein